MDISTSYDSLTNLLQITSQRASNASLKSSGSANVTTANSADAKSADTAKWSTLATSLSSSNSNYLSPILELTAQNKVLQQQLTETLASKFEELGIDTSQTITLGRDSAGNVVVTNDHPDKDAIETLFADTPVLTEAFNTLADNSTTLKEMTPSSAQSLVRANGYAAYLSQLQSSASTEDFFMSFLGDYSTTHFG